MPRGKKKSKDGASESVGATEPSTVPVLDDVRITIEHIVPTTEFGHVKYIAECRSDQVEAVGVLLAGVIGSQYPPFNPENEFNLQAAEINDERVKTEQENLDVDEFDFE